MRATPEGPPAQVLALRSLFARGLAQAESLTDAGAALSPPAYAVAISGGADSAALAALCADVLHAGAHAGAQDAPRTSLRLLHVHHGQPGSDALAAAAEALAKRLALPLTRLSVAVQPDGGGFEAAARQARYDALGAALANGERLLVAHHSDDVLEGLLLALLRGSGPDGLGAMREARPLANGWLLRPLLPARREDLRALVRERDLPVVQDPSNDDLRYDRNYLRHEVLPQLVARWPTAADAALRVAGLQRAYGDHVRAQARAQLRAFAVDPDCCPIAAFLGLDDLTATVLLREWLALALLPPPSAAHMARVVQALVRGEGAGAPAVSWAGVAVRRYRDRLYLTPSRLPSKEAIAEPYAVTLAVGELWRSASGILSATLSSDGSRLAKAKLAALGDSGRLLLRWRQGPERRVPLAGGGHGTLKERMRSAGVPPWRRHSLPMLLWQAPDGTETLLAVPGVYLAPGYAARDSEPGWALRMEWPRPSPPAGYQRGD